MATKKSVTTEEIEGNADELPEALIRMVKARRAGDQEAWHRAAVWATKCAEDTGIDGESGFAHEEGHGTPTESDGRPESRHKSPEQALGQQGFHTTPGRHDQKRVPAPKSYEFTERPDLPGSPRLWRHQSPEDVEAYRVLCVQLRIMHGRGELSRVRRELGELVDAIRQETPDRPRWVGMLVRALASETEYREERRLRGQHGYDDDLPAPRDGEAIRKWLDNPPSKLSARIIDDMLTRAVLGKGGKGGGKTPRALVEEWLKNQGDE